LFFHLILKLEEHRCTLSISDLLYSTLDDSGISNDQQTKNQKDPCTIVGNDQQTENQKDPCTIVGSKVRESIISADYGALGTTFYLIIMQILEAGALLFLAQRITASWRFHFLLLMPFIVIFIIYLTLLPMLFGVLMKQTEISPIKLVSSNKSISCQSDNLYLLHQTAQEFILLSLGKKKVFWLPKSEIQMAEIESSETLFEVIKNR
jgi:hypothetical protein